MYTRQIVFSLLIATIIALGACSADNSDDSSGSETASEKLGKEMARQLKQPIEQAQKAAEIQQLHNQQIQQSIEKE